MYFGSLLAVVCVALTFTFPAFLLGPRSRIWAVRLIVSAPTHDGIGGVGQVLQEGPLLSSAQAPHTSLKFGTLSLNPSDLLHHPVPRRSRRHHLEQCNAQNQ